jgi:hypothetical protein
MPDRDLTMPLFFYIIHIIQHVHVGVCCFCEKAVRQRIGLKERIRCQFRSLRCLTLKHLVNSISPRCTRAGSCTITGCAHEQAQCRKEVSPTLTEL